MSFQLLAERGDIEGQGLPTGVSRIHQRSRRDDPSRLGTDEPFGDVQVLRDRWAGEYAVAGGQDCEYT